MPVGARCRIGFCQPLLLCEILLLFQHKFVLIVPAVVCAHTPEYLEIPLFCSDLPLMISSIMYSVPVVRGPPEFLSQRVPDGIVCASNAVVLGADLCLRVVHKTGGGGGGGGSVACGWVG